MKQKRALCNDKEGDQQKDMTIVNLYAPSKGAPTYMKQILTDIKRKIDSDTIIVGNLNCTLIDE